MLSIFSGEHRRTFQEAIDMAVKMLGVCQGQGTANIPAHYHSTVGHTTHVLCMMMLQVCKCLGAVYDFEHPAESLIWLVPGLSDLLGNIVILDKCRWGGSGECSQSFL